MDRDTPAELFEKYSQALRNRAEENAPAEAHIYHHRDDDGPRINVAVEKNSKGYNWTVTVTSARDLDQALRIIGDAEQRLRDHFGGNGRE